MCGSLCQSAHDPGMAHGSSSIPRAEREWLPAPAAKPRQWKPRAHSSQRIRPEYPLCSRDNRLTGKCEPFKTTAKFDGAATSPEFRSSVWQTASSRSQQRSCGGHATGRRVRCICDADRRLPSRAPSLLERPLWFVRNPERKRRVTQWMWAVGSNFGIQDNSGWIV